ncbi:FecR domain-containing protein [Calycomorphotria hydatis]|uniref:FecR protein n=1 Tax=Calycomorphotria hydatis TaxID=2528027 RepID=A0A517T4S5_9PLAN|nr:FecR domain-containing protein [Calycomorphotria hydatis]QDT63370.1 FecR protein [Calycomorphotria hydatis]
MSEPTSPRSLSQEVRNLTESYCHGTIGRTGIARLEELIFSDVSLCQEYVFYSDYFADLISRARDRRGETWLTIASSAERRRKAWSKQLALSVGSVVGAACVAALVVLMVLIQPQPAEIGRIAVLSQDAEWADGETLEHGDVIRAGDIITMNRGVAVLELVGGVRMQLAAPISIGMPSPSNVRLHNGTLSADVSPEGVGFTVDTSDAQIIDLGTRFLVERTPATATRVFVEKGKVEARMRSDGGGFAKILELTAGQAARFDLPGGFAAQVSIDEEWIDLFHQTTNRYTSIGAINGPARIAKDLVIDLASGVTSTQEKLLIVPERNDIRIEAGTQVLTSSGVKTLPAMTVESYLLHYDPTSGSAIVPISSIAFDSEIVAVITDSEELMRWDERVKFPGTVYSNDPYRGCEPRIDDDGDRISISEDKRTISFHPDVSPPVVLDEMRVLVRKVDRN